MKALKVAAFLAALVAQEGGLAGSGAEAATAVDKAGCLKATAKPEQIWRSCTAVLEGAAGRISAAETILASKRRGLAALALRSYDAAVTDLGRVLAADPRDLEALLGRAAAYDAKRDNDRSIADYDRALAVKPDSAEAFFGRGVVLARKRETARAIGDFSRAVALQPDFAAAHLQRGRAFAAQGETDKALADFDRAIALKPSMTEPFAERGGLLLRHGDYAGAVSAFDRLLALKPDDVFGLVNRGSALAALGDQPRALADFDQAIALSPKLAGAYYGRAGLHRSAGRLDSAIADYDKALELDPDDLDSLNNRALCYRALKRYDAARADLDRAVALAPGLARSYTNRGNVSLDQSRFEEARTDFDKALALDPGTVDALVGRGAVLTLLGDYDKALADLDRALVLAPQSGAARYNRAMTLIRLGRDADALAEFDRYGPGAEAPIFYVLRGGAYERTGDTARAIADYDRAVTLDRSFTSVAAARDRLIAAGRPTIPGQSGTDGSPASDGNKPVAPIAAAGRVALVIGNAGYGRLGRLRNPLNDAAAVGKALTGIGFEVETLRDATHESMVSHLRAFSEKADKAEIALVYYSGHAVQIARGATAENYLIPVDARLADARDAEDGAIPLSRVLDRIGHARNRIVILDSCRDNPFATDLPAVSRSAPPRGLARMERSDFGALVVYSTAPNTLATDGDGTLSPFTQAFVDTVGTKGLDVRLMIGRVRAKVHAATGGRQTPFADDGLLEELYLAGR